LQYGDSGEDKREEGCYGKVCDAHKSIASANCNPKSSRDRSTLVVENENDNRNAISSTKAKQRR